MIRVYVGDHCISRVVCGEHSSSMENCGNAEISFASYNLYSETAAKRGYKVLSHSGVRQKVVLQLDYNFML